MGKWQTDSGTTHDLTVIGYNPDVVPVATPREGGFTLRNRINFAAVKSSTNLTGDASANAHTMRIMRVPQRTIVRRLSFHAVPGETQPTHAYTGSQGTSDKFEVGADMFKAATQVVASIKTSLTAFKGSIAITNSTGAIASFGTIAASTPWTQGVEIKTGCVAFPFGGYVRMNIKDNTGGSSASALSSALMAGVLEVRAVCDYMPE